MYAVLEAIQSSPLSQLLTSQRWAATANSKQILETLHFIAFALQIGAVMVISLRLLGVGQRVPIAALRRPVFWTAWSGFAAVFLTGALQFIPIATEVFYRPSFRAKVAVLGLALVALLWLNAHVRRSAVVALLRRKAAPRTAGHAYCSYEPTRSCANIFGTSIANSCGGAYWHA